MASLRRCCYCSLLSSWHAHHASAIQSLMADFSFSFFFFAFRLRDAYPSFWKRSSDCPALACIRQPAKKRGWQAVDVSPTFSGLRPTLGVSPHVCNSKVEGKKQNKTTHILLLPYLCFRISSTSFPLCHRSLGSLSRCLTRRTAAACAPSCRLWMLIVEASQDLRQKLHVEILPL